jgi:hypothetical protein
LHGNGTNGSQNNTFVDSSTNNFTITRNGNTTQGTFSPYGSNWSNYFDGSGDTVSAASNTSLIFGTGDFTVECWINSGSQPGSFNTIIGGDTNGSLLLSITGSGTSTAVYINPYGAGPIYNQSYTVTQGTWFHLAATRSGTSLRVFVNGTQLGSTVTDSTNFSAATRMIGGAGTSNQNYCGYVSNARIVKGTAVYTSNFTPSTTPLTAITNTSLLTCADNRFIDDSTNAYSLTVTGNTSVQRFSPFSPTSAYSTSVIGGSGYFDGSGDYLQTTPTSSAFAFGTGDFAFTAWIYPTTTLSGIKCIIDTRTNANANGPVLYTNGTALACAKDGVTQVLSGGTVIQNAWNFAELTRTSGSWRLFLNGALVAGPTTDTINYTANQVATMGVEAFGGTLPFTGYMTDVRVLKGSGGTTSTIPTAPLTAVTNTQLLLSTTNAGILDNAMMNDLETVGNAQISTSVKKYGTGSMAFDGTGDWMFAPDSPSWDFGTGDFTLEGWIYPTTSSSVRVLWSAFSDSGDNGWSFELTSSDKLTFYAEGAYRVTSTGSVSANTWTHIAVSRSGSSLKLFINGTTDGTATNSTDISGSTAKLTIAATPSGTVPFTGYIDELRITKGVARYTANFTAPTAAFPDKG